MGHNQHRQRRQDHGRQDRDQRSAAEPIYGKVVKVVSDRNFGFAEAAGRRVFFHVSNRHQIDGERNGEPWLVRDRTNELPLIGEMIFMQVVPNGYDDRSGSERWKAIRWAPAGCQAVIHVEDRDAIHAWHEFTKASRGSDFELRDSDRRRASDVAERYLKTRLDTLLQDGRPNQAQVEVDFVADYVDRLQLEAEVEPARKRLIDADSPTQCPDQLEKLLGGMLRDLGAGQPASAEARLDRIRDRERRALDQAWQRVSGRSRFAGGEEYRRLQIKQQPIGTKLRQDPALIWFEANCRWQRLEHEHAFVTALEQAYFAGQYERVPQLWHKFHATDRAMDASDLLTRLDYPGIYEWCRAGAFELVEAIERLARNDQRYRRVLEDVERNLPSVEDRPTEPFGQLEATMRAGLAEGYVLSELRYYQKYVVDQGREAEFLADPSRAALLEEMQVVAPMQQIRGEIIAVENADDPTSYFAKARQLYQQAPEATRAHPDWWQVECSMFWGELKCGHDFDALQRLIALTATRPESKPGATWEQAVDKVYRALIERLCRDGQAELLPAILSGAPDLFRSYECWSGIEAALVLAQRAAARATQCGY